MNQLQAFRDTIAFLKARDRIGAWVEKSRGRDPSVRSIHVFDMLQRIEENPSAFSPAKLGRWLGWAQAAMCACGVLSLEEAKMINKANDDDPPGKITPEMINRLLGVHGLNLYEVANLNSNAGKTASLVLAEALSKEI